jgi:DNA-directed RNA polymerase subunit beta
VSTFLSKKRIRYSFGKISRIANIPNLIKVQKSSYDNFLQVNKNPKGRENKGLENVLRDFLRCNDVEGRISIDYVSYQLIPSRYNVFECIQRGLNYSSTLKVILRLIVWDDSKNYTFKSKEIKSIKEHEISICKIPIMTDNGTFVINGAHSCD